MNQSASKIQELLNSTIEKMSNKLNNEIDSCFTQNMEDPEGFSKCMLGSMNKYEDFAKKLELYNMFGQKYVLNANILNQDQQVAGERLSNILESSIERLARNYE